MGANNLIEPIDARSVFTAFSATLPSSFYSKRAGSTLPPVFDTASVTIEIINEFGLLRFTLR